MAFSNRELYESILKRTDIVKVISAYIPVIKRGRDYLAKCPFHNDTNPSLHISPEKQIFKCFVDGEGGNAFDFVMKKENVPFREAVRKVADIMGIKDARLEAAGKPRDPRKEPLYACMADLVAYYRYSLATAEGKQALDYLEGRGLDKTSRDRFAIGYAPLDGAATVAFLRAKGHTPKTIEGIGIAVVGDNMRDANAGRVIFPIADPDGRYVGISARRLKDDGSPKYINSPETLIFEKNTVLYNAHNAKGEARGRGYVYVLEGFMDVIALEAIGEPAVALMGTAMTPYHLSVLKGFGAEIRLCLDGDDPGQDAMVRAIPALNKSGLRFRLVVSSDDRDPDDILRQSGREELQKLLGNLSDPFSFQLAYYGRSGGKTADKKELIDRFLPYVASLPAGIEREQGISRLAKATGYDPGAINALLTKRRRKAIETAEIGALPGGIRSAAGEETPRNRLANAEREILYYMLSYEDAVSFFKEKVDSFVTGVYESIAEYVVDFADRHGGKVEPSLLALELSEDEKAEALKRTVMQIASDDYHPDFEPKVLDACLEAINSEKSKRSSRNRLEEDMAGKSLSEKAKILEDYAKKRREQIEKAANKN